MFGGNPVVCTPLDQCHNAGTCNPGTGLCSNPPKADGTTCDDENPCTDNDQCTEGVCAGTLDPDCVRCDNNGGDCSAVEVDQCHEAVCNETLGICEIQNKTDGTTCDDENACTQTDTCQAGVCVGGNPVVCTANQCQNPGICNPVTGICSPPTNATNGTACNDSNPCTTGETCNAAGICRVEQR